MEGSEVKLSTDFCLVIVASLSLERELLMVEILQIGSLGNFCLVTSHG